MPIPDYPPVLPCPIADAGDVRAIPDETPAGGGQLSFRDGFPFLTQVPLLAGGVAPSREDMNAALRLLSQHNFFQQSGGLYPWAAGNNYLRGWMILAADGWIYAAAAPSGPDMPDGAGGFIGAKNPTGDATGTYWRKLYDTVTGVMRAAPPVADKDAVTLAYLQTLLTALQELIDAKALASRTISTTAPLSGGGNLSANRTLTITAATAATASADGAAGSAVYAKDSDNTSRNKAATPAGVAAQVAAKVGAPITAATAATASADGAAGSAVYAKDSDATSRNKAATPAGVAAQVAAKVGAPMPTTAAGVGQWVMLKDSEYGAITLPAGGTWAYFGSNGEGSRYWHMPDTIGGIAAGGTTLVLNTGTRRSRVFIAWRIT